MRESRWRDLRGLHVGGKYWRRGWTDRWFRDGNRRAELKRALGPRGVPPRTETDARVFRLTRSLDGNIALLELSSGGDDAQRVHELAALVNDHINYLAWLRRQDDDALELAIAERLVLHDLMALCRLVRWLLGAGGRPKDA